MTFHSTSRAGSAPTRGFCLSVLSSAALALCALAAKPVHAIEIDTGNPNAVLRWDNTVRYNFGVRRQAQDPAILANANADDGDRNFRPDQIVTNRIDLLSELDWVVDKKYGFRLSAAAWADDAYNNLSATNNATYNTTTGAGTLSDYTNRYAKGPSGEFLDAFVFGSFDLGETPVSVRLGRHTAFWGEGLALGGAVNGVSYGQYSIDIWKANANPGAEAKELYRPRSGLTAQFQATNDLAVTAQTFFDWEPVRLPESGSYFGGSDMLLNGGQRMLGVGPQGAVNGPNTSGDYGLAARWSPEWLDGTAGFYVRRTADILPQLSIERTGLAATGYHVNYARNIDIFGASLNKSIAGVSVGLEASVRKNMPLASGASVLTAAQWQALVAQGDTTAAKGETAHMVLNFIGVAPRNPLFDLASWSVELAWNRMLSITADPFNAYKGSPAYVTPGAGPAALNPLNAVDAATRDASTITLGFAPAWLGVLPETDISIPFSYSRGLSGNSSVNSGGNFDTGNWSIGVTADYKSKYNFAVRYIGAFGRYSVNPVTGAAQTFAGTTSPVADRGMTVFTFKTTF